MSAKELEYYRITGKAYQHDRNFITDNVIGILLQIERKIKLIDNRSNKTDTLRHRIQRTAGEAQQVKCFIDK